MIKLFCGVIAIGCAIAIIIFYKSIDDEGYDLYKVDSSTVLIVRHSCTLGRRCIQENLLSGVSKKECKQYAKIKGLKIKR